MRIKITVVVGLLAVALCAIALTATRSWPVAPWTEDEFVRARGGNLWLGEQRYRFVGVNIYSLLSAPSRREGFVCGVTMTDADVIERLDELAAMGVNVIRLAAFQSFTDGGKDLARFDLVLREAERRGIRLIPYFEGQWGNCSTKYYLEAEWYRTGYREPYHPYELSYRDYVARMVRKYRNEPAILAWQLMNEAEASDGAISAGIPSPEALFVFAADMGALIKEIDPRHPISLGTSDDRRVGLGMADYSSIHALRDIDIVEGHDYDYRSAFPQTMQRCQNLAIRNGKPFFIGEMGVSDERFDPKKRASLIGQKLHAAWQEDVDGIVLWSYRSGDGRGFDFAANDPVGRAVAAFITKIRVKPSP